MQKKVLFTGGSGLLAINWAQSIAGRFDVVLGLHKRVISIEGIDTALIDIENADALKLHFDKLKPDIVVHCAAMTNVERCEEDPELAAHQNIDLAVNVATVCREYRVKFVFISTDHLYSGNKKLLTETDAVEPINSYALTKARAEEAIRQINPESLIIRTNFYGWGTEYRYSFSDFIISSLRNNISISLFADVHYTPILIEELAEKVMALCNLNASGIFNVTGNERISKYEFGLLLAGVFGLNKELVKADLFANRKDLVQRPLDLSLSNKKTSLLLNEKFDDLITGIMRLQAQEAERISVQTKHAMIPYGRQDISEEDIDAVISVLRSDWLTQGPLVPEFEKAISTYCGAGFGVAVNSATSALHIACLALGVGKGDWVWTSPITFVASANCAIYCGASVDFVDIDPLTYNMSVEALDAKLQKAEKEGRLPKVVIPVHLAGQSCDMETIHRLSERYGFKVIEDASHCIGGKYKGQPIGSCRYSSIVVFSFHPVKIITTGEGGMAMTNDHSLAVKMAHFRSHGIVRHEHEMTQPADGPWYYQQTELGFNYRMTDLQAALGLSQLKRLPEFVEKRHAIARRYDESLTQPWITLPYQHPDNYSGFHLYIIRIKRDNGIISHKALFEKMRAVNILVNLHYIPVYRHPFYQKMGFANHDFPEAECYYKEAISIPIFPGLTIQQQDSIVEIINQQTEVDQSADQPKGFQNIF